jgi:metallo-beta-lactamase class B
VSDLRVVVLIAAAIVFASAAAPAQARGGQGRGAPSFAQQSGPTAPRSNTETVNPGSEGGAPGAPDGPRLLRLTTSTLPDTAASLAHKQGALARAKGDPVLTKAYSFFCTPTRYNEPGAELDAARVFDNLYALPSSPEQQTIVWAITTRDGIVLVDSGQAGRTDAIVAEMQKVGLNPADVKYILLGHGHGDHFAGAAYFQERYGTRVAAGARDWDLMHPPGAPADSASRREGRPPRRDLVLEEGTPVTLGEQTVRIVEIPGHTPGSVAFIFTVRERGATHTAGLVGGTILDQPRITIAGLTQYLASIGHYLQAAKTWNVDVEIQNHALFDDTPARLAKLKTQRPGEPNPFLMSAATYDALWNIVSDCIRAEIGRRPAGSR